MTLKLYLATSCLQTRPMLSTIHDLLELEPYGLQLTAGNILYPDLKQYLEDNKINYLMHHNFSWTHYARRDTWTINSKGKLSFNAKESHSVHPPMKKEVTDSNMFWNYINENLDELPILETMYPPDYYLSNDDEMNLVMDMNLKIAVDISHIYIQLNKNSLSQETWKRVQEYHNIKEIHVSSNKGRNDSHQQINSETFGLEWAKNYALKQDIPLVLECYMHKLSFDERRNQIEIIKNK